MHAVIYTLIPPPLLLLRIIVKTSFKDGNMVRGNGQVCNTSFNAQ